MKKLLSTVFLVLGALLMAVAVVGFYQAYVIHGDAEELARDIDDLQHAGETDSLLPLLESELRVHERAVRKAWMGGLLASVLGAAAIGGAIRVRRRSAVSN